MAIFKKSRRFEVLDLRKMQKDNLLRASSDADRRGIVDFSRPKFQESNSISDDFLSSLANVGASNSNSVTDSLRVARQRNLAGAELNEIRLKLEDNNFKLNDLMRKVKELEMRLREKGF